MKDQKMKSDVDFRAAQAAVTPNPTHGALGMLYEQHMKSHLELLRAGQIIQEYRNQNEALQKQVAELQEQLAAAEGDDDHDLVETETAH